MTSVPQGGIYAIYGPDGGIYIGSARVFQKRWVFHRSLLRRNTHYAVRMQDAYNAHGAGCLRFAVLEYVDDMTMLHTTEQRWLDRLFAETPRHCIYNVTPSANGATGRKATPETRAKLSAVRKGRPKSEETRRRMSEGRKGMRFAPDHCNNNALAKSGGKAYTLIAPDGAEYPDVVNLSAFAREHGLSKSGLQNVAAGNAPAHKGWNVRLQLERGTRHRDQEY